MKVSTLAVSFFLLIAGAQAGAAPVNWTLSSVSFSGGKTLSGTFTYDSDTNAYSSVNLSYFDGATTHTLSTVHLSSSTRLIASSGGNGTPGADLFGFSPALSNAAGSSSYTAYVGIYNGSNLSSSVSAAANISGVATTTVPGAPTGVSAQALEAAARVSFTAPSSNGGAAITGYTVTASPGGITATGSASPITVTGLTNGTAYTFTVKATNSAGDSAASSASNAVTPAVGIPTLSGWALLVFAALMAGMMLWNQRAARRES
jgi:hypothetical protein